MTTTVPPHRLAVLAQQAECALDVGRSYVEIPTVDLLTLIATVEARPVAPTERDYHYLCCACGAIRLASTWTYWRREPEEGETWIPSSDDPMCRCPACGWEHVDDDSGPGLYDGTLEEMVAERARLVAEGFHDFDTTDFRPAALPA